MRKVLRDHCACRAAVLAANGAWESTGRKKNRIAIQRKRLRYGEELQGSGRSFRRPAETELSGLCNDDGAQRASRLRRGNAEFERTGGREMRRSAKAPFLIAQKGGKDALKGRGLQKKSPPSLKDPAPLNLRAFAAPPLRKVLRDHCACRGGGASCRPDGYGVCEDEGRKKNRIAIQRKRLRYGEEEERSAASFALARR